MHTPGLTGVEQTADQPRAPRLARHALSKQPRPPSRTRHQATPLPRPPQATGPRRRLGVRVRCALHDLRARHLRPRHRRAVIALAAPGHHRRGGTGDRDDRARHRLGSASRTPYRRSGRRRLRRQRVKDVHFRRNPLRPVDHRSQDRPSQGAKGISLLVAETNDLPGFERGRVLKPPSPAVRWP